MKYARIVNETVVDARTEPPEGYFTPEVVAEFITVPDHIEDGWRLVSGEWQAPPPPTSTSTPKPTPEPIPIIGPIAFQMLFTVDELTALEAAKATDPKVRVFSKLLDDPRTSEVNRNLPQVQDYLRYCETASYLSSGRAEAILYGKLT